MNIYINILDSFFSFAWPDDVNPCSRHRKAKYRRRQSFESVRRWVKIHEARTWKPFKLYMEPPTRT